MNSTIRNILAFIAGAVVGSLVNMGIIMISESIVPPPNGADVTTMEGLKSSIHLFQPIHFLFPFLAHALGTLAGAMIAFLISADQKFLLALSIGALFLVGGIANTFMFPAPIWFIVLDLLLAYLPMGYLASIILTKNKL